MIAFGAGESDKGKGGETVCCSIAKLTGFLHNYLTLNQKHVKL